MTFINISQRRIGDTFFIAVLILASAPLEVYPCEEIPFTEQVTLETADLTPGTYTVDVNGVKASFEMP